jgi:hypothetical protein
VSDLTDQAIVVLQAGGHGKVGILQNDGPQEPANLCASLQIKYTDLERDIAALRHMQKIRGALIGGKKLIRLW